VAQAGILPDHEIAALFDSGALVATRALDADQIQPASLDLRLGAMAWRVRASFLPGPDSLVGDKLERLKLHAVRPDRGRGAGNGLRLHRAAHGKPRAARGDFGLGQSEELDRPARHLHPRHVGPGRGIRQDPRRLFRPALSGNQPAHLPDPRARAGSRLSQIRFRKGGGTLERSELHRSARRRDAGCSERPNISGGGIALSIDLSGAVGGSSAIAASGIPA
jgi:dCTP deaminase